MYGFQQIEPRIGQKKIMHNISALFRLENDKTKPVAYKKKQKREEKDQKKKLNIFVKTIMVMLLFLA